MAAKSGSPSNPKKEGKAKGKPDKTKKPSKSAPSASRIPSKQEAKHENIRLAGQTEWLQDVSMEMPVPADANYLPGERELEFSVGMRQQELDSIIRSELRARALVHANGNVLMVVEASYVNIASQDNLRPDLPQYLYAKLRSHMESLMALAGHTPPLPPSLEKVG